MGGPSALSFSGRFCLGRFLLPLLPCAPPARTLELQGLALSRDKLAVCLAGPPPGRTGIDQGCLGERMSQKRPHRLEVFRVLVKIELGRQVPELVRSDP